MGLYRVLIIDDEPMIVQGLMKVVSWKDYNCEVVATAADGVQGRIAIIERRPDIVFTDIRMPTVDGLTMLSGIKSEFPDMQITVLTGFRNFEYAQQAIKIGVTRFLLKPSKMSEIDEALNAMTANLLTHRGSGMSAEEDRGADNGDAASNFIVRQALHYMERHYAERISLADVASKCYVSQWHLSKLLNRNTNQNFYDILNGIRVKEAKVLLSNPSLRISEISEKVGYADAAHFSKVFKRITGLSANEYRNLSGD